MLFFYNSVKRAKRKQDNHFLFLMLFLYFMIIFSYKGDNVRLCNQLVWHHRRTFCGIYCNDMRLWHMHRVHGMKICSLEQNVLLVNSRDTKPTCGDLSLAYQCTPLQNNHWSRIVLFEKEKKQRLFKVAEKVHKYKNKIK